MGVMGKSREEPVGPLLLPEPGGALAKGYKFNLYFQSRYLAFRFQDKPFTDCLMGRAPSVEEAAKRQKTE